jgi:hypothetical protein
VPIRYAPLLASKNNRGNRLRGFRRRLRRSHHVFGDRRLGHLKAKHQEFAMDGGVANVNTVLVAGRVVKRDGKLLYAQISDKKIALQKSGERILTDFGLLPLRAA